MKKVSLGGTGSVIGKWKEAGIKAPMLNNDPTFKKQDAIRDTVEFVLGLAK